MAFSIRPGITRSYKRDPYREEVWQNSGFGLYMVSNIINKIGGYFEIASNSARITIKNGFINHSQNKIQGTEVTAVFNTKIKINIAQLIGKVATKGNEIAANNKVSDFSKYAEVKTASKASTLIK